MFNKQNGQTYNTTCLSQCCMFTKRLTEVNLVNGIARCSVYMCMFVCWTNVWYKGSQ